MPRPGRMTTERAKDFKGTLLQLVRNLGRYRRSLVTAIVFAILSTIFNIAGPKVLAKATTALATGWIAKLRGTGSIDFVYIGRILLFLLGMYLLSSAFSFIQGWLMTGLSQKVCYDFRKQISEKINRLPLAYFEKRTVGEVLSRITNDVDTLGQSLNQSITQLITSVTTMIGVLVMMLSISPKMTLIALLILPVSLALVLVVVKFSQKYFKAQQATLGVVNGQVEEVYSGHNVIKAFNREAAVLDDFNAANDKLYESAWKSQFLSGLMQPIMTFVGNLGYVAVAIVGSIFAAAGAITIGDIQAFIQYVKNFTQPIQQLAQVSNMLQSMTAAAERVFEFLNEPEEDQLADPARRADPNSRVRPGPNRSARPRRRAATGRKNRPAFHHPSRCLGSYAPAGDHQRRKGRRCDHADRRHAGDPASLPCGRHLPVRQEHHRPGAAGAVQRRFAGRQPHAAFHRGGRGGRRGGAPGQPPGL